ncbi:MAG TPA: SurA N-terminal domain-containing protein [Spirochaetia bacterium]|nr:SurA N-terminal domain-containing protein [Spirochaetia bacterium]
MAKDKSKKTIKKTTTMPKTSSKTKKAVKVIKTMRSASVPEVTKSKKKFNFILFVKLLLIVAIGIVVFLLVQKNKGLFIAGTVNKTPVSRWELNAKMAEKYADQTFEEIVSEKLLQENLKKNNIVVTDKEVQDELAKIKIQYGGEEQFKAALTQFGMTEEKALQSIEQSIGLKKLIESSGKIEITDVAVSQYFTDNKASYADKKLDEVADEIKEILYQQDIYTKSQEWYSQVRKDAKVSSFL